MESSPFISGESDKDKKGSKHENLLNGNDEKLVTILEEYKDLLEIQAGERKQLLTQVDTIAAKTQSMQTLDGKIEHLVNLLADIRVQIGALTTAVPANITPEGEKKNSADQIPTTDRFMDKPTLIASKTDIKKLSTDIEKQSHDLDDELQTLSDLLEGKTQEVNQKDGYIDELNEKLEGVSEEKDRLAAQLESLNAVIGSWQGQLNLLQKLAASDPRYKVIGALKKHGSLSDIQLAFTMGTSITQIRKYIDDLRELDLVKKDNTGRYIWIGQDLDDEIQA